MGGLRQFEVLLRKNLLLKTRRPCATCFELLLPLVLFALLARVRRAYHPTFEGPFFFADSELFPLSSLFWGPGNYTSQGLFDAQRYKSRCKGNCWSWTPKAAEHLVVNGELAGKDSGPKQDASGAMGALWSGIETQLLCSAAPDAMDLGGAMGPLLKSRSRWTDNLTLEELALSLTLAEAVVWVNSTLERLLNYTEDVLAKVDRARTEYLASTWRSRLEGIADTFDEVLWRLTSDLGGFNTSSFSGRAVNDVEFEGENDSIEIQRAVDGAVEGFCSEFRPPPPGAAALRLSGVGWALVANGSAVVHDLGALADALESAAGGVAELVARELRLFARALRAAGIVNATDCDLDSEQLFEELDRLVGAANATGTLASDASGLAQAVDVFAASRVAGGELLNGTRLSYGVVLIATALASLPPEPSLALDLKQLSDWLESSGLADLAREDSGTPLWRATFNETMREAAAWFAQVSSSDLAEMADSWAWWTSHFLNANSTTVRMLDELAGASWLGARGEPGLADRRTEVGDAVNQTILKLQDLARSALDTTDHDDRGPDLIAAVARAEMQGQWWTAEELWAWLKAELLLSDTDLARAWADAGLNASRPMPGLGFNASWPMPGHGMNLTALIASAGMARRQMGSDLAMFLDALRSMSAAQIEAQILPSYSVAWLSMCGGLVNSSAVAGYLRRAARCPFVRGAVGGLAERRFSLRQSVDDFHSRLRGLDIAELQRRQRGFAESLRANGPDIANATKGFVSKLQKIKANSSQVPACFRVARDGCEAVQDEATCLESQHRAGGPPCAWCHDGPCATTGKERCRAVGEVSLSRSYTVAERPCNLDAIFMGTLLEQVKAARGVTCGTAAESARTWDSTRLSSQTYLMQQITQRKILIAPYRGEVEELFDYFLVEVAQSVLSPPTDPGDASSFLQSLARCPLVGAAATQYAKQWLQDHIVFLSSSAEVEEYALRHPDEVLFALDFMTADPSTGNFPPGAVNVEYAMRLPSQLAPSTTQIVSFGRRSVFGGAKISDYPYLDLYFVHIQEAFGRAAARLEVQRGLRTARRLQADGEERSEVLLNAMANDETAPGRRMHVHMEQFPSPQVKIDGFIRLIQQTLPLFMILGWIYAVSLLVKEVVYEKQERLRDVMRIMGLKTWVYWASWTASALIQLTLLVLVMVAILKVGKVLPFTDATVIFVFFFLYSLATIALALLISSFFSRAKVAAACGGVGYYVLYLPYTLYSRFDSTMGTHAKNALCLMSSTGLGLGIAIIAKWELLEIGAQWGNIFEVPPITSTGEVPTDDHCLGHVFLMLILDAFLYILIAWYIERVFPGTLGLPQPWYFPVLPSYWFPGIGGALALGDGAAGVEAEQRDNEALECHERAHEGLQATVRIRQLCKTFRNGKQALRGISLDMHDGTIIGLLGHNGAGKSTTMSILTGLYPPTKGDVLVNGVSVCRNSIGVRRQLGVCLQHNALYDNLTVQEHLRLFCSLKSVPKSELQQEIDRLLRDVGLEAKRNVRTRALSGGMKRKLSICIALSGGSKVVTLDEPTAGVDATSRRDIWQLLAFQKAGRTIVLSTHFMDEADILSDRIAIIAEGRLIAIGTSLHLKRHFANGYMLNVVLADGGNAARLFSAITSAVPTAKFAGARGREFSYVLPFESRAHFAKLFRGMQDSKVRQNLGVDAYGLSAASMEEVFLRASSVHEAGLHGVVRNGAVEGPGASEGTSLNDEGSSQCEHGKQATGSTAYTDDTHSDRATTHEPSCCRSPLSDLASPRATPAADVSPARDLAGTDASPEANSPPKPQVVAGKAQEQASQGEARTLSGVRLAGQQFGALFRKRALSVRRDRRAWASQLLLPAIFVLLALIIAKVLSVQDSLPPLKLSSEMFLGTLNGGATHVARQENLLRVAGSESHPFAREVESAFVRSAKPYDEYVHYKEDAMPLSTFFMENNRQTMSDFGAVTLRSSGDAVNMTLWFSNLAPHALPVMTNLWNNARFKLLGQDAAHVQVWNHPLPKTAELLQEEMGSNSQVMTDLTVAITVILAMGFIPASFVVYLVNEKSTNGKHQQYLTGVKPSMYWINNYAWDVLNFLAPLVLVVIIFAACQVGAYSGSNMGAVVLLLLFYGACMTPCMYCLEPFFRVPSTGYVTLIVCNIFTGTITVLAVTLLDMFIGEVPDLAKLNDVIKGIFPWVFPNYCLGRGFIEIATNHYRNLITTNFGLCAFPNYPNCTRDPLVYDVAGRFLLRLVIMAPVWFTLRLLIEWGCCLRGASRRARRLVDIMDGGVRSPSKGDAAVQAEAERVNAAMAGAGIGAAGKLVIHDLAKSFTSLACVGKTFHAVRGLSLSVPAGECFGLLGVNGAGKTTTMRMITGDTEASRGDIYVGGWSLVTNRDRARQHLGYCPQFDALPDLLTVRETLALYARIRGVPPPALKGAVDSMVQRMCLEAHQHNLCQNLSGGNKRKLSTALALTGQPDVILLDEPSTGVDVGARRFLWELIGDVRRSGHSVVLTSHSMEECEVLCTRLTIMVHGQFRCLGSPTELKGTYGGGYTMTIKANLDGDAPRGSSPEAAAGAICSAIRSFVASEVPMAVPTEESVGLFRYRLGAEESSTEVPLADIFQRLESANAAGGALSGAILDYAVSQTSLEEVFLHFSQVGEREYAEEHGSAVELPTAARSAVFPIAQEAVSAPAVAAMPMVAEEAVSAPASERDEEEDIEVEVADAADQPEPPAAQTSLTPEPPSEDSAAPPPSGVPSRPRVITSL